MTDFETVARAEERSRLLEQEREDLIEEFGAPVFDGTCWTFPAKDEGEEQ